MKNMFLVGVVPFTTEWWQQTLYGICQGIDAIVYWLGESAYQVFMLVAKTNIFDYNDPNSIGQIVNRIYVILGIVMVFVFGYTILTLIANPDKMSSGGDNSFQGIIKNTVISIIIIALLPTAYNYLYKIQDSILSNNVIGNIILAGSTVPNDNNYNTAATVAMTNIFTAFYHPIDGDGNTVTPSECDRLINVDGDTETIPICEAYLSALYTAQDDANSSEFITNAELRQAITDGYIEYIPLVSTLAGALAAYLFVSFALDLGVRAVKLSVLQVIAPIPVIARISSGGKKIFDSWFKQIKSTYLLVFVRLATIYFAMFTIQLIVDNVDLWPVETGGGASRLLVLVANVIVILGILQFVKDAPKLISDLFGVNGKITWRIKDKLNENEYGKRAIAAVGTVGNNLGRALLDTFGTVDENGRWHGRNWGKRDTWHNAVQNVISTPGRIFHGARYGMASGNVDITQIGSAISSASNRTSSRVNEDRRTRESFDDGLLSDIPGLSWLLGAAGNTLLVDDPNSKGFFSDLFNKLNGTMNASTEKNSKAVHDVAQSILELAKKGTKEIEDAAKDSIKAVWKDLYSGKLDAEYQASGFNGSVQEYAKKKIDAIEATKKSAVNNKIALNMQNNNTMQTVQTILSGDAGKKFKEGFSGLSSPQQAQIMESVFGKENSAGKTIDDIFKLYDKPIDGSFTAEQAGQIAAVAKAAGDIESNARSAFAINDMAKKEKQG